jgi:hypothetical protein
MPNLNAFLEYYHASSPNRIYEIDFNTDIAGYFFIHDLVPPHHCHVGCFFRRRYWGDLPEEFGKMILPKIHELLGVERVYGFTPGRAAASLAERIGMKRSGVIPQYASGRDVYVFIG